MNLSKEIIMGLGFEETVMNGFDMYKYSANIIRTLYLEKTSKEKEFYIIYKKDENYKMKEYGQCETLSGLVEIMMKINNIDSIKLGKKLKQQEIKSILGFIRK